MSANHEDIAVHAATCLGDLGMGCVAVGPGHAMHPMQQVLAAATPSSWLDAVVGVTGADGWTTVHALEDGRELRLWQHGRIDAGLGEPVALHPTYHVLAVAGRWLNVLVDGGR